MFGEQVVEKAPSVGSTDCSSESRGAKVDPSISKVLPNIDEHLRQLYLHLKRYNELRLGK